MMYLLHELRPPSLLAEVCQVIQATAHHEHGVREKKDVHFLVVVVLGGLEGLAAVVVLELGVLAGDNQQAHGQGRQQDHAQCDAQPAYT